METRVTTVKNVTYLSLYLFIVWGFYRFLFRLPEEVEEFFIKPLIWLIPVFYLVKKEGKGLRSLGVTSKNLFPAIYYSLFLGVIFALEGVVANYIKYSELDFSANVREGLIFYSLGLSLIVAITEEITFRGYIFSRLKSVLDNSAKANLITSSLWGAIHIPLGIFWYEFSFRSLIGYFLLVFIFGIGSAFVFDKTKNIFSSILLHIFWTWPIILFR